MLHSGIASLRSICASITAPSSGDIFGKVAEFINKIDQQKLRRELPWNIHTTFESDHSVAGGNVSKRSPYNKRTMEAGLWGIWAFRPSAKSVSYVLSM